MDNMDAMANVTVKKQKETYSEKLGKQEVADYKKHYFDLENYGGQKEAEDLIKRYKEQNIELEEADRKLLIDNAPPKPDFPILNRDQYKKKSCFKQRGYRTKVENYFKARKNYYTMKKDENNNPSKGMVYTELRERIETGNYYKKSQAAKDMDAEFEKLQNDKAWAEAEEKRGKEECDRMKAHAEKNDENLTAALESYSMQGFQNMNMLARRGFYDPSVESITDYMKKHPLNRDLVVKRAVDGVNTLAFMMGLKNAGALKASEIKKLFQEQLKANKEFTITDKGFVSTSLPSAREFFHAGGDGNVGIEFIIRCKKGTAAMNIQSISMLPQEGELLLGAGTKFKVVDAQLDGKANILHGCKKSWKIYLETIPVSEEGIKKEVAA